MLKDKSCGVSIYTALKQTVDHEFILFTNKHKETLNIVFQITEVLL